MKKVRAANFLICVLLFYISLLWSLKLRLLLYSINIPLLTEFNKIVPLGKKCLLKNAIKF